MFITNSLVQDRHIIVFFSCERILESHITNKEGQDTLPKKPQKRARLELGYINYLLFSNCIVNKYLYDFKLLFLYIYTNI